MHSARRLRLLVVRSIAEFADDNCTQMAAAISYYVLFSLFPLLIFLVGVLGIVLQDSNLQDDLVEVILDYVPLSDDEGRNDVTEAVRGVAGVGSGALGILGLLGMAWSGSNMFGVIRRSLNAAYDIQSSRPFVRQKLVDFGLMIALGPFFVCSVAATAGLRTARSYTQELVGASSAVGLAWDAAVLLVPFLLSFAAFLVLYWLAPAARLGPRDVWPGALVAALLFESAKVLFSLYLENFANYDVVFGSLGAVVAFLFWVYVSANILLLGAEVASEYPRVRRGDYDLPEGPQPAKAWKGEVLRRLRGLLFHEDSSST